VLAFFFVIIISYAIHEKHIAGYADVFRSVTDKEEAFWIRLGDCCSCQSLCVQFHHLCRVAAVPQEEG